MDSEKVIKRDNEYVLHTYGRNPIVLEKGHGLHAEGPEGQQYLDFTSGIGVNSLGYCDLDWAEAVSQQAHKLQHTSNLYYTAPCGKLAKKLCKRTGMSKVFFGNSGAEANEGAIKAARKYSVDHYGKDRTTVITLVNSFHGRTIATLTATGQEVFHNYFGPFNEGFLYAPAGDIEALKDLIDRHTCAVMLELIQGGEEKESDIIARMNSAKLVIFDDLGAERNTDYALEKIYNIIDSRYRRKLPMLLTTNLTIDEMKDEEDRRYSRIYDRIFETCYSMQFTGPSWRKKEASRRFTEMEKLFDID